MKFFPPPLFRNSLARGGSLFRESASAPPLSPMQTPPEAPSAGRQKVLIDYTKKPKKCTAKRAAKTNFFGSDGKKGV